ncbi:MAG: hypothetical protein JST81_10820 [Bacteroidetes bacterium]|nr:hypothetical protein [Bacteroidota bacterium]
MSSCTFSIPFEGTPDKVLIKARFAVESQGGTFTGDTNAGEFAVTAFGNSIAGSYTVAGQNMNIIITDKPFMIPCSMIEGFLKSQLTK